MKPNTTIEIMLFTNTTFAKREFSEKNSDNRSPRSAMEQLEEACWNGLLNEMLPEILDADNQKVYLWQIQPGRNSLQLGLAKENFAIETRFSIDPYYIIGNTFYN